jgi:hypothetical protein
MGSFFHYGVTGARNREHAWDDAVRWLRCQRMSLLSGPFSSASPPRLKTLWDLSHDEKRALQEKPEKKKAGLVRARP